MFCQWFDDDDLVPRSWNLLPRLPVVSERACQLGLKELVWTADKRYFKVSLEILSGSLPGSLTL